MITKEKEGGKDVDDASRVLCCERMAKIRITKHTHNYTILHFSHCQQFFDNEVLRHKHG